MFKALADQPDVRMHIARGWILIGSLGILFVGGIAIGDYAFDMPVHDRNTGELATSSEAMTNLLIVGGGMATFLVMGILLYLWKPEGRSDGED
jgi:hypothetical protein